jgi:hypothetical protein
LPATFATGGGGGVIVVGPVGVDPHADVRAARATTARMLRLIAYLFFQDVARFVNRMRWPLQKDHA